ncbi:MAG: hypothetical protein ACTS6A_00840 [Candidatus Hodgkinia cicadicola]
MSQTKDTDRTTLSNITGGCATFNAVYEVWVEIELKFTLKSWWNRCLCNRFAEVTKWSQSAEVDDTTSQRRRINITIRANRKH